MRDRSSRRFLSILRSLSAPFMIALVASGGSRIHAQNQRNAYLFVTDCGGPCSGGSGPGTVSVFAIDLTSGVLNPVPGSPFVAGSQPASVVVDPTSRFAYTANVVSGDISAYTVDPASGELTAIPGSPFSAGIQPESVAVDPTGRFLYAANCGGHCVAGLPGSVSAYAIDSTTGGLTPLPGSPFPADLSSNSVVVHPLGQFVYVTNQSSNDVSAFRLDPVTGSLTPLPGSPFPTGGTPNAITIDPSGHFAYVADFGSNDVWGYAIDPTTGALSPAPGTPFAAGSKPYDVTVDATGQFVYVVNQGSSEVSAYAIDAADGALTPVSGSPFSSGGPTGVVTIVGTTQQLAYVVNTFDDSVSAFGIDSTSGGLAPGLGSPFASGSRPLFATAAILPPSPTPNTPAGAVTIQINDPTTGATISVAFTDVTQPGLTSVVSSAAGPPSPPNFSLGSAFYYLSTTALFSGPVSVCLDTGADPSVFQLVHYVDGAADQSLVSFTEGGSACGTVTSLSPFVLARPLLTAVVQPPINAAGTSVFNANRGVVPVKFTLSVSGASTCQLPAATVAIVRTSGVTPTAIDQDDYIAPSDSGSNFRIEGCHYAYNVDSKSLGVGTYSVQILVAGTVVGSAIVRLR